MIISIIAAVGQNRAIGKDNKLLWHISADLKKFKSLTTGHAIIMGRKTFESIGKPLPNRTNIIVSRNENYKIDGCITLNSLDNALKQAKDESEVFIIGGGELYKQALPLAHKMYLTMVFDDFDADTFFPEFDEDEWIVLNEIVVLPDESNSYHYAFKEYQRKNTSR